MANVANSKHTGPASKDTVAGGKKFAIQTQDSIDHKTTNGLDRMTNSTEAARKAIMGMRVKSEAFETSGPESTLRKLRAKRNVSKIPKRDFPKT